MRRILPSIIVGLLVLTAPLWAVFPTISATAVSEDTDSATTHNHTLPASSAGDLIIHAFQGSASDAAPNSACPGFTLLRDGVFPSAVGHVAVFYQIAAGDEGTTVDCTTDLSEQSVSCSYVISAASWHGSTAPEAPAMATGTSTTPDPAAVTPSWGAEDTKFIAVMGSDNAADVVSDYPDSYGGSNITEGISGNGACAMGARDLNATTDDPNTFTVDASQGWAATTIAVRTNGAAVAATSKRLTFGVGF